MNMKDGVASDYLEQSYLPSLVCVDMTVLHPGRGRKRERQRERGEGREREVKEERER